MEVKPVITLRTAVGLHALNEYFKDDEAHCYQKLIPLAVGHNIWAVFILTQIIMCLVLATPLQSIRIFFFFFPRRFGSEYCHFETQRQKLHCTYFNWVSGMYVSESCASGLLLGETSLLQERTAAVTRVIRRKSKSDHRSRLTWRLVDQWVLPLAKGQLLGIKEET